MTEPFPYAYVVVIETASNQNTIFLTNRLRENIGASQLIYQVGTDFIRSAMEGRPDEEALTVVSASGNAILVTRDDTVAEAIIAEVTWRTLQECPGIIARGAYAKIDDATARGMSKAVAKAHSELNAVASDLPSPVARFARLPFVENCASSGYPARAINEDAPGDPVSSEVILARRSPKVIDAAHERIGEGMDDVKLLKSLKQFEEASERRDVGDWIAIVHADGNGLGQVFLSFDEYIHGTDTNKYVEALGAFSKAIDNWSRKAAHSAIKATWADVIAGRRKGKKKQRSWVPVAPVVLGGDDLTVICEGERAVRFAANYLRAFEEESRTALSDGLGGLLTKLKGGFIAAAAGIAIVKPHFPFHRAYELAEQLAKSAKTTKDHFKTTPCSALDFQVVFDTSGAELEPIRDRMKIDVLAGPDSEQTNRRERLYMRPYVVTPIAELSRAGASDEAQEWAKRRHYDDPNIRSLSTAVNALSKEPKDDEQDDPSCLPRSQAHDLHEALYLGQAIANGRLKQIEHRYKFPWETVCAGGEKNQGLFVADGVEKEDGKDYECVGAYLMDAMELVDLDGKDAV